MHLDIISGPITQSKLVIKKVQRTSYDVAESDDRSSGF